MPLRFEIDKEKRLVRSYSWGEVTFDDVFQHQKRLRAHPDFDDSFDEIVELTNVLSFRISSEQSKVLARQIIFSPSSRRAFVAPSQLAYGMLRMFEAQHELSPNSSKTMTFTNESEALAWLNSER